MFNSEYLKSKVSYNPETGLFFRISGKRSVGLETGTYNSKGYRLITIIYEDKKKQYYAHRLAWLYMTGEWPANLIDHINNVKHDNRWCNLRAATNAENLRNRSINKNNTTGFKGVHKNKEGYMVRICIGTYKTLEEAVEVYEKAAKYYHGEFYKK